MTSARPDSLLVAAEGLESRTSASQVTPPPACHYAPFLFFRESSKGKKEALFEEAELHSYLQGLSQWTRFPQEGHNQRWIMCLWLWPKTKSQSTQWKLPGSPLLKKGQQSCSKIKTMLTVFFDWEDIIHHQYAPLDQTINKEYYLNVLHQLRDAVWWKWLSYGQLMIGSFIMTTRPCLCHLSRRVF